MNTADRDSIRRFKVAREALRASGGSFYDLVWLGDHWAQGMGASYNPRELRICVGAALVEFFAAVREHAAYRKGWNTAIAAGMDYDLAMREQCE